MAEKLSARCTSSPRPAFPSTLQILVLPLSLAVSAYAKFQQAMEAVIATASPTTTISESPGATTFPTAQSQPFVLDTLHAPAGFASVVVTAIAKATSIFFWFIIEYYCPLGLICMTTLPAIIVVCCVRACHRVDCQTIECTCVDWSLVKMAMIAAATAPFAWIASLIQLSWAGESCTISLLKRCWIAGALSYVCSSILLAFVGLYWLYSVSRNWWIFQSPPDYNGELYGIVDNVQALAKVE